LLILGIYLFNCINTVIDIDTSNKFFNKYALRTPAPQHLIHAAPYNTTRGTRPRCPWRISSAIKVDKNIKTYRLWRKQNPLMTAEAAAHRQQKVSS
jgi:hypothetical protein